MTTIQEIFTELVDTNSTKVKQQILEKYKDNNLLKQIFYLAYSPRIKFYIKKIPEYFRAVEFQNDDVHLNIQLYQLKKIYNREITGHKALEFLSLLLTPLSNDYAKILENIILKDLKLGINTSTINKVWNNLIEETPYQGAISYNKKKALKLFETDTQGVVSQEKLDGRFCNAIILNEDNNTTLLLEARSGETTYLANSLDFLKHPLTINHVLNGELVIEGVDRYTSNGIIASLISIHKKINNHENPDKDIKKFELKYQQSIENALQSITYVVWDVIAYNSYLRGYENIDYKARLRILKTIVENINNPRLKLVETKQVNSLEEALEDFNKKVSENKEGIIIKGLSAYWKDGKPNWAIKIKMNFSVELRIIGFNEGKKGTRFENNLGSLVCSSEDGLLNTDPAGITDEIRQYIWDNKEKLIDTIVEVECSGISKNNKNEYSVLHPRFIKLRDDRTKANTLAEILQIEQSVKSIL